VSYYKHEIYDSLGILRLTIENCENQFNGYNFFQYMLYTTDKHDIIVDLEKMEIIYKERAWRSKRKNAKNKQDEWGKYYHRDELYDFDYYSNYGFSTIISTAFGWELFAPQFYLFYENGETKVGFAAYNERKGWLLLDIEKNVKKEIGLKDYDLWSMSHNFLQPDKMNYGFFLRPTKDLYLFGSEKYKMSYLKIVNLNNTETVLDTLIIDLRVNNHRDMRALNFFYADSNEIINVSNFPVSQFYYFSHTNALVHQKNFNYLRFIPDSYAGYSFSRPFYAYYYKERRSNENVYEYSRFYNNLNNKTLFIARGYEYGWGYTPELRILDGQGIPISSHILNNDSIHYHLPLYKTESGFVLLCSPINRNQKFYVYFVDEQQKYRFKELELAPETKLINDKLIKCSDDGNFINIFNNQGKQDAQIGEHYYEDATVRLEFQNPKNDDNCPVVVVRTKDYEYWFTPWASKPYYVQVML
jgi:hypothetical protein